MGQTNFKSILWRWLRKVYQNCKFHNPRAGVLMLGHGHIRQYSEYALNGSSALSIYSTLIAVVLWDDNAAFLCHCRFLFILWWCCWYANMRHFWQEVSIESLILRWRLRPVALLLWTWTLLFCFFLYLANLELAETSAVESQDEVDSWHDEILHGLDQDRDFISQLKARRHKSSNHSDSETDK